MKQIKKLTCHCCGAELNAAQAQGGMIVCEYCKAEYVLERDEVHPTEAEKAREASYKRSYEENQEGTFHEYVMPKQEQADAYAQEETLERQRERSAEKKRVSKELLAVCLAALGLGVVTGQGIFKFAAIILLIACVITYTSPADAAEKRIRYERLGVQVSPKNKWVAFILCLCFGVFGVHFFYTGRIGRGIAAIFTFDFFGIGYVVDLVMILCGRFKDCNGGVLV